MDKCKICAGNGYIKLDNSLGERPCGGCAATGKIDPDWPDMSKRRGGRNCKYDPMDKKDLFHLLDTIVYTKTKTTL